MSPSNACAQPTEMPTSSGCGRSSGATTRTTSSASTTTSHRPRARSGSNGRCPDSLMPGDSQQPIGMTPTARHTVAGSINAVTAGASAENDLRQDLIDLDCLQTRPAWAPNASVNVMPLRLSAACPHSRRKYPRRKPARNLTLPTSTTGGSVEKTRSGASRAMTFTTPSVMKGAGHQCLTNSRGPSYHPLWDSHAYANGERSLLQPVPAAGRMPENK